MISSTALALLLVAPIAQAGTGLLIENARIVDGTGGEARAGDVRVVDGAIREIGELEPVEGEEVFDAAGRVLAPGFIDTHSHHDVGLDAHPQALAAISQGFD